MLATHFGVESTVLQADEMLLALANALALAPLLPRLEEFHKHVGDLLFLGKNAAWSDALQLYALLQRRARVDGAIAEALAPVAALFAPPPAAPGSTPKRTARANARALERLKESAPELLAPGVASKT
jgi:hypothetical protein